MQRRWLFYGIIGLFFGIVDWYYLDLLASTLQKMDEGLGLENAPAPLQLLIIAVILLLNWGIWLVPVIPVALFEAKRSKSIGLSALAAVTVWSLAIVGYYLHYTFLLMFWGLPHMDFMLFANRHLPTYWQDWKPAFQRVILSQFFEWLGVALFGGALVGGLTGAAYRRFVSGKRNRSPEARTS